MTYLHRQPWGLLNQFSRELSHAFDPYNAYHDDDKESVSASDWTPAVNIQEFEDRFVIHADIPGVAPEDIEINMDNGILTISGTRIVADSDRKQTFKRSECPQGTFLRRFTLPDTTDAEKVAARSSNGVLEVTIPKHARVQPRTITVQG